MDDLFRNRFRIDSTRLKEWDYSSSGDYFVTVCVKDRECAFGHIKNERMILSAIGVIAEKCWTKIPNHFPFGKLDEHAIMPNHVHGIIIIDRNDNVETQDFASPHFASLQRNQNRFGPQSNNLGSIVRGFKIGIKKWAVGNNVPFE